MKFRLISRGNVLREIVVDEDEQVLIERDDATPLVGLSLDGQGGVSVGHWPDGEVWREAFRISPGTPQNACVIHRR